MEQELQKRVLKITESLEATMIQETGVQSSLSEDDVRVFT
jgi:glutaredoxin 2